MIAPREAALNFWICCPSVSMIAGIKYLLKTCICEIDMNIPLWLCGIIPQAQGI
ncbi:Uncharacterised protein [Bordetella pertussis]|nr:Uncharacterised protein [Bordetella pertussis]